MSNEIKFKELFSRISSLKTGLAAYDTRVWALVLGSSTSKARGKALALHENLHQVHSRLERLENGIESVMEQAEEMVDDLIEMSFFFNGKLSVLESKGCKAA